MIATKKGVNILERGSQVHFMAEFQELLDFPPAPKLDIYGKIDQQKGTESETERAGDLLRKSQVRLLSSSALLYRQLDAQLEKRAFLQAPPDQWKDGLGGWSDQNVSAQGYQRLAAISP